MPVSWDSQVPIQGYQMQHPRILLANEELARKEILRSIGHVLGDIKTTDTRVPVAAVEYVFDAVRRYMKDSETLANMVKEGIDRGT